VIQNPGFLPDHARNWTTCSLCHALHTLRISKRSVHNFSSYLGHTDRQTKNGKNITSLAEVIKITHKTYILFTFLPYKLTIYRSCLFLQQSGIKIVSNVGLLANTGTKTVSFFVDSIINNVMH